jgi:RNA polymerase sigma-70 factor (ECF subfamily)
MDEVTQTAELTKRWTGAMPAVSAFLRARLIRFHDAEDLLQDVASEIVLQFPHYNPKHSFTAWALGIARNKLKLYYRRTATQRRVLNDLAMIRLADAVEKVYENSGETSGALSQCLRRIDDRARELLTLRYVHDLTHAEIARRSAVKPSAVKVALHRLRAALLRCIEDRLAVEGGMP